MRTALPGMTYQRHSISLTSLGLALAIGLGAPLLVSPAAAQDGGDVNVNLEALGLTSGANAESTPRLILKYPGSSTATRSVPPLRYPDVPAPAPRPTPPKAVAAPATPQPQPATPKPEAASERASAPTPARPEPAAAKPETEPSEQAEKQPAPVVAEKAPVEAAPPPEPRAGEQARATAPATDEKPAVEPPTEATAETVAEPQADTEVAALSQPPAAEALSDPAPAILRVIFDPQTAAIIGSARKDLDAIGESLRYDPRRIELKAYGGTPGDKASEARRISLKRGLAVRAYLIGLGIDSRRIDVRAMGGITDTGAADRVDVAYSGT